MVSSPVTLLDQVAPALAAINGAKAWVVIGSPNYEAMLRASAALHRLAADLGHRGRLAERAP